MRMRVMRVSPLASLAIAACSPLFDIGDPKLAPDAGSGSAAPTTSCPVGPFDICANETPTGPISFDTAVHIDSDSDCNVVLFNATGTSTCVVYATAISVPLMLRATGARPLVLAARDTITVNGVIDVSTGGAGAGDASCASLITSSGAQTTGGYAGGSFGGVGGAGGNGTGPAPAGQAAGAAVAPPAVPRGGCPGGFDEDNGFSQPSGGSVWLVAGQSIEITATGQILAGGGGGGESFTSGGGGCGGASGGFIRLAAPTVSIAGLLEANGGGGGEANSNSCEGAQGSNGNPSAAPALGGAQCDGAGDGGSGAAGTVLAGTVGANATGSNSGGGGGGGGAGIIQLASPALDTTGATISPPAI